MNNMEPRVSLTTLVASVLWVVCATLICAQAFMDMDVGWLGVLFGLAAVAATVRRYFIKAQRV